jgi:uncharacterized membrane protein YoaK (UPF0700 family)
MANVVTAAGTRWDATRAVTLGLVGGYVDTVGFVMLRGLFPNHVTGNLPVAAAHPGWQSAPALLMVPWWLAVVVVGAGAAGVIGRHRPDLVLPTLLGAEATLLAMLLVAGVALVPDSHASTLVTQTMAGAAGVAAMAVQSVVTRLGGYAYPTTMVTGTLTLLGLDAAAAIFDLPASGGRPAVLRRIKAFTRVVLAFAVGAGLGGLFVGRLHFWAMVLPVLSVAGCAAGQVRAHARAAVSLPLVVVLA